jgi:hypothetical protein
MNNSESANRFNLHSGTKFHAIKLSHRVALLWLWEKPCNLLYFFEPSLPKAQFQTEHLLTDDQDTPVKEGQLIASLSFGSSPRPNATAQFMQRFHLRWEDDDHIIK